ncbi:MAG: hypothetical protein GVY08_08250 [Bacteroidetes bacterium]|jgi:hypothetical protein|nr:hypothetical protein [Bacteroidota bacterium]
MKKLRFSKKVSFIFTVIFLGTAAVAYGHVKWFSDFSFADKPLSFSDAIGPLFIGLTILSMVVIAAMVLLEKKLQEWPLYSQIDEWLRNKRGNSLLIMRIVTGATLLLSWQGDAILVPELQIPAVWLGWVQFILAFMLLFDRLVKYSGAGLIFLYIYSIFQFGAFHMLDHLLFFGAGYFLLVSDSENQKIKESRLPVLYATVGFSLCWLAIEKIIYPQWALYILEQNPQLTLGLDVDFFLMSAAFVEFALGYLLIICLLQRPLALIITLVFFSTTLVFGKVEVIGHTLAHGALIVFLLEGPGSMYKTPITFHKKLNLRSAFGGVNFALLLGILLFAYSQGAWHQYNTRSGQETEEAAVLNLTEEAGAPSVTIDVLKDPLSGWNLRVETENFTFAPESIGLPHEPGEGHAHLYINERKAGRIYGEWNHIGRLPPGTHTIRVELTTNQHRTYAVEGNIVADEAEIKVE